VFDAIGDEPNGRRTVALLGELARLSAGISVCAGPRVFDHFISEFAAVAVEAERNIRPASRSGGHWMRKTGPG
jgi:hypothetical protein